MHMKIGFIGAGNMGGAIIRALLQNDIAKPENLYISRRKPELSNELAALGVHVMNNNVLLAEITDCIVLAVKPAYTAQVLSEARDALNGKLLVSIVAGWTYDMLQRALPKDVRLICAMPNTPLAIGEGMTLICDHYTCTEQEYAFVHKLFAAAGKVALVESRIYEAASGISGCGPAFVYQFIEALADGGVRYGVPRALAYELVAQTLIGAAKMMIETGEHPGRLKDEVCSPGGTTIEGVYALERGGFRAAVMDAVAATREKTLKLSKN